jgi:hypothetical protein
MYCREIVSRSHTWLINIFTSFRLVFKFAKQLPISINNLSKHINNELCTVIKTHSRLIKYDMQLVCNILINCETSDRQSIKYKREIKQLTEKIYGVKNKRRVNDTSITIRSICLKNYYLQ